MLRKKIASATGSVLTSAFLLASGSAVAAEGSGFYAGAALGQATNKADEIGFDASDTAFKIFGGYSFNKYFGVELAYLDGGSPDQRIGNANVQISASGFIASFVGSLPLGERFSLFGKLGYASGDSDASLQTGNTRVTSNDSVDELAYGVGAAFGFTERFSVRAEYEAVDVSDGAFNVVSISGLFRF